MQTLEPTPERQLFRPGQTRLQHFADPITFGLAAFCISAWLSAGPAVAAPPPLLVPGEIEALQPNPAEGGTGEGPFGFLTGDMWGLRPLLSKYGISLAVSETSEVLGNVTGGIRQGFEYDGLTQIAVQLDTQQAFGWYGGTFRASALQIHGRNLSADNLLTLQTASGIEADPGARLWELWYQQKFLDEDRADVKIGQMSLDQEFIVRQNAWCSSIRCSAGRWCHLPIFLAAVPPIPFRPSACGCGRVRPTR
jgi:porin